MFEKLLYIVKRYIPIKLFQALQPAYHFLLSALAAVLYRWPSEKLIVIGVTGTTGKTTSVYLIAKTLAEAGYRVGFTSTAMFNDGRREWLNDKKMTMVGRFFTQRMFKRMIRNSCQYAVVETTSEGIRQFRHRFINYDILVFTGLYPEHIESHGGFANYKKAKGELFKHLRRCKIKYVDAEKIVYRGISGLRKTDLNRVKKTVIANLDDEHAAYFLSFWAEEKIGYRQSIPNSQFFPPSRDPAKAVAIPNLDKVIEYGDVNSTQFGTSFAVNGLKINLKILGAFNVANAMNAVCVGLSQGLSWGDIKRGLENIEGVAGRLEKINASAALPSAKLGAGSTGASSDRQKFLVIVDYAFEPNAVAKLYKTIKFIPHKKVIHVLGSAGGGRDVARRPLLGRLAGEKAGVVIITNEDPYDEDPQIIINEVAEGAMTAGKVLGKNLFKILDRRQAIKRALESARDKDIVLITGKGSEQAICAANGEKIPWDDRAVVRGILSEMDSKEAVNLSQRQNVDK